MKGSIILVAIVIIFFASIFHHNITTYISLEMHSTFAVEVVVKVWDENGSWYCRYRYIANGPIGTRLKRGSTGTAFLTP